MKRRLWILTAGVWIGATLNPVWAAPTDPSQSGTMDLSHEHDDTNADINARTGEKPPLDTTKKSQDEMKHPKKRHSPKVSPSDSKVSPKVNVSTATQAGSNNSDPLKGNDAGKMNMQSPDHVPGTTGTSGQ